LGTVYRLSSGPDYALTFSYSFGASDGTGAADGRHPQAGLAEGFDGFLYGVAAEGGANLGGTIFRFNPTDLSVESLWHLSTPDGTMPVARLVQASDGAFYGTTNRGGTVDHAVAFRFATPMDRQTTTVPSAVFSIYGQPTLLSAGLSDAFGGVLPGRHIRFLVNGIVIGVGIAPDARPARQGGGGEHPAAIRERQDLRLDRLRDS
jgi:hypothetical protein